MIAALPGGGSGVLLVGVAAVLVCAVRVIRRRYLVVTVRGASMQPALAGGDRVLVDRRRRGRLVAGDMVAVRRPAGEGARRAGGPGRAPTLFVKRLAAVAGEQIPPAVPLPPGGGRAVPPGTVVLLGDGEHSLDSRAWGCVPEEWIVGVVVRRLRTRRA